MLQTESGRNYDSNAADMSLGDRMGAAATSRLGCYALNNVWTPLGMEGSPNNSIIRLGGDGPMNPPDGAPACTGKQNYFHYTTVGGDGRYHTYVRVTWREPLFCSPFSSRYDATYGRPLYNITSMDINLQLQNLGNMIRVCNFTNASSVGIDQHPSAPYVADYSIKIESAMLCYQVMTIPPNVNKPLTTLVPYRRFVPFVTKLPNPSPKEGEELAQEIASGTYTLNEIPTAIWAFIGPETSILQNNYGDVLAPGADNIPSSTVHGNWDTNKLFGYLTHVNLTLANTTQILNTAEVRDLYRIAKANGCEDPYWSWACYDGVRNHSPVVQRNYYGAGSVLRMIPGIDIIIPDQPLIPGANANNMVFQMRCKGYIPPHSEANNKYALWLIFEYVGVAAISPGQCEVTMNPLGSGEIMAVSPIFSATSESTEGKLEGMGVWGGIMTRTAIAEAAKKVRDRIANILKRSGEAVASWGTPKRARTSDSLRRYGL